MSWDDIKRGDSPFGGEMPDFGKIWRTYKKWILTGLVVVLLVIPAASSFYTVHVNEEAVVLRLGKYLETTGPGLNFKLPFGIDQEHKREVKAIHKEEFGFRTLRSGVESEYDYDSPDFKNTRLMLTADLNCAELRWVVRYKIGNLQNYLFNVRNVRKAIRDVSEAVMRKIAGNSSIDEVLMTRQKEMEDIAKPPRQRGFRRFETGKVSVPGGATTGGQTATHRGTLRTGSPRHLGSASGNLASHSNTRSVVRMPDSTANVRVGGRSSSVGGNTS